MENTSNTVEMIRKDAIIPIEIGAGFYARLQQLMGSLIADKTAEEIQEITTSINEGKAEINTCAHHYETCVVLCRAIDDQAKKLHLTVTVPVESLFSEEPQAN